jgi:hypothetical protein
MDRRASDTFPSPHLGSDRIRQELNVRTEHDELLRLTRFEVRFRVQAATPVAPAVLDDRLGVLERRELTKEAALSSIAWASCARRVQPHHGTPFTVMMSLSMMLFPVDEAPAAGSGVVGRAGLSAFSNIVSIR